MAGMKLDRNEAAFLAALKDLDPEAENWYACWALLGAMGNHGADSIGTTPEGAFSVAKNLYKRKLVDKQPGRATLRENGYALNQKGKDALAEHDFSETKD